MSSDSENDYNNYDEEVMSDKELLDNESDIEETHEEKTSKDMKALSKKKYDPKFSIPNENEEQNLRNAGVVIQSNLLDMQVEELLSNVSVNYDSLDKVNAFLKDLQTVINSTEEQDVSFDDIDATALYQNTVFDKPISLHYQKPYRMDIIGSYLLRTSLINNLNIDIAIQMPDSCFSSKDYLDYVYFNKRSLYLYVLMKTMKEKYSSLNIYYSWWNKDYSKPIICIDLGDTYSKYKYTVRLIPSLSHCRLDISKLNEERNNCRQIINGKPSAVSTSYYTNLILEDMYLAVHTKYIYTHMKKYPNLGKTIQLLKVFLFQHNISQYGDSINGFYLSVLLCSLCDQNSITSHMTPTQMVKIFLEYIVKTDFKTNPIKINTTNEINIVPKENTLYILDGTYKNGYNVTFRVTEQAYRDFINVCKCVLTTYTESASATAVFNSLYANKQYIYNRYDQYIRISMPPLSSQSSYPESLYNVPYPIYIQRQLILLTERALKGRILSCRIFINEQNKWKENESPKYPSFFYICLSLDPSSLSITVNKGPSAEDQQACAEYRAFWGAKSELRRYKDGSILETTLWTVPASEYYRIPVNILTYIYQLHLPCITDVPEYLNNVFDKYNTVEDDYISTTMKLQNSLAALSNICREMRIFEEEGGEKEIEGYISSVESISYETAYLSLSAPYPSPLLANSRGDSSKVYTTVTPIYLVANYHCQRNWGEDISVYNSKMQLIYITLSRFLKSKNIISFVTPYCIDIIYNGYIFRLNLYTERESNILLYHPHIQLNISEDIILSKSPYKVNYSNSFIPIGYNYYIHNIFMPQHISTLKTFYSEHPTFSSSLRLLYIWFHSHLLSFSLPLYILDLMMMSIYTETDSLPSPNSAFVGFYRCLQLISNYNWNDEILLVDIHNELNKEEKTKIIKSMNKQKKQVENKCCLYICTPRDKQSKSTTYINDKVLFKRFINLATQSINIIHNYFDTNNIEKMDIYSTQVFTPSYSDFDIIIDLKQEVLLPISKLLSNYNNKIKKSRGKLYLAPEQQNLRLNYKNILLTGHDPIQLIYNQLFKLLKNEAYIFGNHIFGNSLYIVWKPSSFISNTFKLSQVNHTITYHDCKTKKEMTVINIFEIMNMLNIELEDVAKSIRFI
ncbi:hypothetical protein WA158_006644 [Blastocystis sp. Blastoise]